MTLKSFYQLNQHIHMQNDYRSIITSLENMKQVQKGLDPVIIKKWYDIVINEAKISCPEKLVNSIKVEQDQILLMKFELKSSKRAIPYIIDSIEKSLDKMPVATKLYFLKLEEVIQKEYEDFYNKEQKKT